MKRFLSLALVVVLVMAMGAVAFAGEDPGTGNPTTKQLTAELDVKARILPYAKIAVERNIDFGQLEGSPGIYTANGHDYPDADGKEFGDLVAPFFGENLEYDRNKNNANGYGIFTLESNTDVKVAISFDNKEDQWVKSKTIFAISRFASTKEERGPLAYTFVNFGAEVPPRSDYFVHEYDKYPREVRFGVDGAIYIESISQQKAGNYFGTVVITVSKD